MSNDHHPQPSAFELMECFHNLSQSVILSANEVALFHALLQTWNAARRPIVLEQWAENTARNAGMTTKRLAVSRQKLVDLGVIFFEKRGNRAVPRYSLEALIGRKSPFSGRLTTPDTSGLPAPIQAPIQAPIPSKIHADMECKPEVNLPSYQVEDKDKKKRARASSEKEQKQQNQFADNMPTEAANDMQELVRKINAIGPPWQRVPNLSYQEMCDLSQNARIFADLKPEDWEKLTDYFDAIIPESYGKFWQPQKRSMFLKSITDVLTDADRWSRLSKWKPKNSNRELK